MRKLFISILILLPGLICLSQTEKIIALDTVTFELKGTDRTWYKGVMKDTIIHYKKISIDTILCYTPLHNCDTLYFVQYFDQGWRYIEDTLFLTDYRKQEYGFLYRGFKEGLWDFTGSPSCFTNGTLSVERYLYYRDQRIPQVFKEKYYFLNDTITGIINTKNTFIETISESVYFTCFSDTSGYYNCMISLPNGQLINRVPLKYLDDEIKLVLSGYYNRKLMLK